MPVLHSVSDPIKRIADDNVHNAQNHKNTVKEIWNVLQKANICKVAGRIFCFGHCYQSTHSNVLEECPPSFPDPAQVSQPLSHSKRQSMASSSTQAPQCRKRQKKPLRPVSITAPNSKTDSFQIPTNPESSDSKASTVISCKLSCLRLSGKLLAKVKIKSLIYAVYAYYMHFRNVEESSASTCIYNENTP